MRIFETQRVACDKCGAALPSRFSVMTAPDEVIDEAKVCVLQLVCPGCETRYIIPQGRVVLMGDIVDQAVRRGIHRFSE